MELDETTCWQAFQARDRRFEGRFVMGVHTTGIYCRPGCPARLPARLHVRFFACPAAAEAQGFRPCRRCQPDASPGSPLAAGTSATVARALRLIEAGALDDDDVPALAERLGIGDRHLRRLFVTHLGAAPRDIAMTRRVHFARRLIESTELRMMDVAAASGFPSVQRLSRAVRRSFRVTPGELRARVRRSATAATASATLTLQLPCREPYDAPRVFAFLAGRAIAGVERVESGRYQRIIDLPGTRGVLELEAARPGMMELRLALDTPPPGDLLGVTRRVARLLDLNADTDAIGQHLGRDPVLRPLLRRLPGLRVPGAWDPFEMAIRAIVGQQVSVKGATTLMGRIVRAFGEPCAGSPVAGLTHAFPAPAVLADAELSGLGLTGARIATIRALAAAVADGSLRWDHLGDLDAAERRLTELPGIGRWTAQYIAMRALGEPDAFPVGDLGLLNALSALLGYRITPKELERRAEAWRPWRAYATLALWLGAPAPPASPRKGVRK